MPKGYCRKTCEWCRLSKVVGPKVTKCPRCGGRNFHVPYKAGERRPQGRPRRAATGK